MERAAWAWAFGLVLALPVAGASSGDAPLSGNVSFLGDVLLKGAVDVRTAEGILALVADRVTPPRATFSWDRAEVQAYHNRWNFVDTNLPQPAERVRWHSEGWIENSTVGAATLDDFRCGEGCRVFVVASPDGSGVVGAQGAVNGPLRWLAEKKEFSAGSVDHADHGWQYYADEGWLRAGNVASVFDALLLSDATPIAQGDLWIVLSNGSARLTTLADGRSHDLDSSSNERPLVPFQPLGGPMVRDHVFYAVHAHGAKLATRPGTFFTFTAPRETIAIDGLLSSPSASGTLRSGDREAQLHEEPLTATGAFSFDAHVTRDETLLPGAAPHAAGTLSSESGTFVAQGVAMQPTTPLLTPARGAQFSAIAVLFAIAARSASLAYVPGYSRIARADVLANENRRRLFETIRASPGLTLTECARRLQLARVVALHHARMLIEHKFVVERAVGGRRFYYAAESAPALEVATATTVLTDATRRKIADAIVSSPTPPTQRDLVERTGIPQRLVSYHLSKLVAGGLVRPEGRLPRRYRWE